MLYRVHWWIDIEADSHREAVLRARDVQLDPASPAVLFETERCLDRDKQLIDLKHDEDQNDQALPG